MNPQRTTKAWFGMTVVLTLLVIAICAKKAVAQNTFPTPSGNVGIGTANPDRLLTVFSSSGSPAIQVTTDSGANTGLTLQSDTSNRYVWSYGGFPLLFGTNGTEKMRITGDGNVGIGTTSPQAKLQVNKTTTSSYSSTSFGNYADYNFFLGTNSNSNGDFSALRFSDAGAGYRESLFGVLQNANGQGDFFFKGYTGSGYSEYLRITSSGNVGIGTASPTYGRLQVEKAAPGQVIYSVSNSTSGTNYGIDAEAIGSGAQTNVGGFFAAAGATYNYAIIVPAGWGNVGIGTSTPDLSYKLDVNGDTRVSGNGKVTGNLTVDGNIAAKYQDVAEWVESSETLAAGTVVVLDSTKSNQVIASTVGYDTRVAGVISAQPGITLGEKGEGKVLVATTGRVKIKVDASKSPIHIGDLLVTSDVPGVAMRSEPIEMAGRKMHMPGTLIGKALEPLAKGSGEILVLLSLQ